MQLIVNQTTELNGKVLIPSSKSQSIRALLIALLAQGNSTLENFLEADDTETACNVAKLLGADINKIAPTLKINASGLPLKVTAKKINTGNSGITTRFILPLLGLRENFLESIEVDCGEQMRGRPIESLVNALNQLGMEIHYLNDHGKLPLNVKGKLIGGQTEVAGITSQYLSALLLTLPCAENPSEIRVKNLHERPYIEMTLTWLNQQGIHYFHLRENDWDIFRISGKQIYHPLEKIIPGDFSSASCILVAACLLKSHVELLGLDMNDSQGDKRLITILQQMGANITLKNNRVIIDGGDSLHGIKIDANEIPDLLPALAVAGCFARGKTEIFNVKQARIKETDRIHSMTEGLRRLGAQIEERDDGMLIYQSILKGNKVKGYDDHRTVMALSVAGLLAKGQTEISDAEAINKTFPGFVQLMRSLQAKMRISG